MPPKGGAGLGVHITPTVDGNILLGPTAAYIRSKIDTRTTAEVRRELLVEAAQLLPGISAADVITAYSGVRPKLVSRTRGGFADFVIEEAPETPGMMHLVGIESPGLTAAPALGVHVAKWVLERIPRARRDSIRDGKRAPVRFRELGLEERAALIEADPDYGRIVCRCELVTEREILDAIRNPLHARSLTSLKYRSRAMMGRCQGGFCGPRIVDILVENGIDPASISLRGGRSWMFIGSSRDVLRRANGDAARAGKSLVRVPSEAVTQ
ncbi:MAG: FAD-dependent oxidoreductase [Chloroflexi bacterium]|nr:FAD-dependent oxidoreductase [Chloroflexota bacterium]